MKILLVGADKTVLEQRIELLRSNGYDVTGVGPKEAAGQVGDPQYECLILGASLGERRATKLALEFGLAGTRYVIRVAEPPVTTNYPYADVVVNPGNPAALLGAVKALALRCK